MPYQIREQDGGWVLMHKKGGKWTVKSHHKTRKDAVSAMRLLYGIESGNWKPTGVKTSKVEKIMTGE